MKLPYNDQKLCHELNRTAFFVKKDVLMSFCGRGAGKIKSGLYE
jgi:hypothetical protein